MALRWWQR